jgi:hypothetical protein
MILTLYIYNYILAALPEHCVFFWGARTQDTLEGFSSS